MTNMINKAKSTKILYYKDELERFDQYPNFILLYLYIQIKKGGSFLDLFYRNRTSKFIIPKIKKYIIHYVKNKNKYRKAGYRSRTDDHRITNAML